MSPNPPQRVTPGEKVRALELYLWYPLWKADADCKLDVYSMKFIVFRLFGETYHFISARDAKEFVDRLSAAQQRAAA